MLGRSLKVLKQVEGWFHVIEELASGAGEYE